VGEAMNPLSNTDLREAITDIFSDAADKVAPKQANGSIERKVALGMVAETIIPLIALFQARERQLLTELLSHKEEAYLNGVTKTIEYVPVSVIEAKLKQTKGEAE
jgi:hypothetical protein